MNTWELILTGDACPYFNDKEFRDYVKGCQIEASRKGNAISFGNNSKNGGGCGYLILNSDIATAQGQFFIILSNDDTIFPNHFENYYNAICATNNDFMYFDTFVQPHNAARNAQLQQGMIGHSELIIKTSFLKKMPAHGPEYGHDWKLVQDMMAATSKYAKGIGLPQTYNVRSVPGNIEQGID